MRRRTSRRWPAVCAAGLVVPVLGLTACGGSSGKDQLQQARDRGVLRVGLRPDDPPHSFVGGPSGFAGFDVEIADAIARRMHLRVQRVRVDELTRISFLRSGRIDAAVASINHTRQRESQIDFSQTYFFSSQSFLVRRGKVRSLRDLVGKPVGFKRGSSAIGNWRTWLMDHGVAAAPRVIEFGDPRALVEAVKSGAIAGWGEDFEVLQRFAHDDRSLTVLPGAGIGPKQDGVGIRENQSRLRDAIDIAIQDIVRSGEYDRIYARWFGPRTATPVPRSGHIEIWPAG